MTFVGLLFLLVLVAIGMYLLGPKMDPAIRNIIYVVIVLLVVVFLFNAFGFFGGSVGNGLRLK